MAAHDSWFNDGVHERSECEDAFIACPVGLSESLSASEQDGGAETREQSRASQWYGPRLANFYCMARAHPRKYKRDQNQSSQALAWSAFASPVYPAPPGAAARRLPPARSTRLASKKRAAAVPLRVDPRPPLIATNATPRAPSSAVWSSKKVTPACGFLSYVSRQDVALPLALIAYLQCRACS